MRNTRWQGAKNGAPGRSRTRNLWVRSPALSPLSYRRKADWQGVNVADGASDGIRTRDLLCHRQAPWASWLRSPRWQCRGKAGVNGQLPIMIAETGAAFNRLAAIFKKSPILPPVCRKVAINGGN